MDFNKLLIGINHYVMNYLNQNADEGLTYHNAEHAQYVARAALKISRPYKFDHEEIFVLTVASWFHDTGYLEGPENHEVRSSEKAKAYLLGLQVPADVVNKVGSLILATQADHQPVTLLEEVIRDADLYHLGTASFDEKNRKLHQEEEFLKQRKISRLEWYEDSLEFLKAHRYYTTFCQLGARNKKQQNIQLLQSRIRAINGQDPIGPDVDPAKDAARLKRQSKGMDTFFQIASSNSQQLSNMADNKANILITVNSIMISAIISYYLRKMSGDSYLFIPIFLILIVSLVSMICSILATRPKLSRGTFNQKELNLRKVNLLFFGNFYKMKIEKYTEGVLTMINDLDYLHNSLIKDVYYQGLVLGKKYFLLRLAYNIFMIGLILAVLSFVVLYSLHINTPKIKGIHHH